MTSGAIRVAMAGLVCLCWLAWARGADLYRVETRSGGVHIGTVELGDGVLRVVGSAGSTAAVPGEGAVAEVAEAELRAIRRLTSSESLEIVRRRPATRESKPASGLRGEYFPDTEMSESVLERVDASPNFSGRRAEPTALDLDGLPDSFSIRWTGQLVPPESGEYRFWVSSDDGARVWVNDVPIADQWGVRVIRDVGATAVLEKGKPVSIRIEYMDIGGGQFFQLDWQPPGQARQPVPAEVLIPVELSSWPGEQRRGGWRAEYFSDNTLGTSVGVATEGRSVFEWGDARPPGVDPKSKSFSMRLSARLFPEVSGKHRMRVEVDDRVRIFVGEQKVYDTFEKRRFDGEFDLDLDRNTPVAVKVEYLNDEAQGHLRLRWRRPGSGDMRDIPVTALGLPPGEDVAPLIRVERKSIPLRFFRSDVGERAAEARVWSATGSVREVQWLAGGKPLATTGPSEDGVYRLPLSALPIGRTLLRVRATDSAGRSSVSEGVWTEAEGLAGGIITGPWRDARIGDAGSRVNLMREAGTVVLRAGIGDIDTNADTLRLVARPIGSDHCIEAKLLSMQTPDGGLAFGGLMVRQNLEPFSPAVSLVLDSDGGSRVVYRRDGWQPSRTFEVSVAAGSYVRLARETEGVRLLTRPSREAEWKSVWFGEMRFEGEGWAGVFAVSRSGAPFLRLTDLEVTPIEPAATGSRGVMLVNGTFISGEPGIDDDRKVRVWTRDRSVAVDPGRVAYIGFGPLRWSQVQALSARAPCALMRGEDISEGELVRLRDGRVVFDSDLFGRVSTEPWSGEIRAVATRKFRIDPTGSPVGVRTRDLSCLRGESFRVRPDGLQVVSQDLPGPAGQVRLDEIADRLP